MDYLELDRGEASEAALAAPTVVGSLDPSLRTLKATPRVPPPRRASGCRSRSQRKSTNAGLHAGGVSNLTAIQVAHFYLPERGHRG